jgi:hypothetical protein
VAEVQNSIKISILNKSISLLLVPLTSQQTRVFLQFSNFVKTVSDAELPTNRTAHFEAIEQPSSHTRNEVIERAGLHVATETASRKLNLVAE